MRSFAILILLSLFFTPLQAQSISDISTSDGDYSAIKNSLKKGYFSLYSEGKFKPNTPLSRREASIIVDKLIRQIEAKQVSLSQSDLSDLKQLSSSFKTLYSDTENTLSTLSNSNEALTQQVNTLHHDVTELTLETQKLKKDRKLLFLLLGISTVLGIAI